MRFFGPLRGCQEFRSECLARRVIWHGRKAISWAKWPERFPVAATPPQILTGTTYTSTHNYSPPQMSLTFVTPTNYLFQKYCKINCENLCVRSKVSEFALVEFPVFSTGKFCCSTNLEAVVGFICS